MGTAYEEFRAPVAGGSLAVLRWPGEGPVVLAAHGITANALSWSFLAEQLDGAFSLVAPDLRGRAGSAGLPGPYGMAAHADDLVAVLDALAVEEAVVVGHSMGAFAAAVAALRHPDRVRELVLVDGGVGFPTPPGADLDAVLQAVIGPAMQRLQMTFPSLEAYLDFWRPHPALQRDWSPQLEEYLARDLVGKAPHLRSSCSLDAVRTDGGQVLRDEEALGAVRRVGIPTTLLWAERGLLDQPQGLYDEVRLAQAGLPDSVRVVPVPDVNHYSVLLSARGAAVVADRVRAAVGASARRPVG